MNSLTLQSIHSTRNLSGGESFLVSFSQVLGLSHMASKNVWVDSPFLDEGFGTLDEDALDTVLKTPARLQEDGKTSTHEFSGALYHVTSRGDRNKAISVVYATGAYSYREIAEYYVAYILPLWAELYERKCNNTRPFYWSLIIPAPYLYSLPKATTTEGEGYSTHAPKPTSPITLAASWNKKPSPINESPRRETIKLSDNIPAAPIAPCAFFPSNKALNRTDVACISFGISP